MSANLGAFLSVLTLTIAGHVSAASISVNLSTANADTLISALPYGVESSSVWNQGASEYENVVDDLGATTTMDVDIANPGTAFTPPAYNNTVFRFGDNAVGTDTLTLSQIPYTNYKIIVYMAGATTLEQGTVSDGTTTYFYAGLDPESTSFVEITDTAAGGTPVEGNYAVFGSDLAPLSGATQSITYARQSATGAAAILGGFQVVQVPEPSALAVVALGGLLMAARRRR